LKKILLVWPYHRKDWIKVFTVAGDDFEFSFLSYIDASLDRIDHELRPERTFYWSQFVDGYTVLKQLKPEKIIFMSIDSGLSIALNYAARKLKVPTYILQHGIYTNYKDYRIREKLWGKKKLAQAVESSKKAVGFSTVSFVLHTVRNPFILARIFAHAYAARRFGPYFANRHFSFRSKKPDFYICFSRANARIHEELDRPRARQFIFTGSPELDTYLKRQARPVPERFIIHIDQALSENSFGEETVSKDDMIRFYAKLNVLAERHGARLFIKLHPESYTSDWLPLLENITYLRDTPNIQAYLQHAEFCTGFYSTLMIPAAYWNRIILFRIFYSYIQEFLGTMGNVRKISFAKFDPATVVLPEDVTIQSESLKAYFHEFDGRSVDRIKAVLSQ